MGMENGLGRMLVGKVWGGQGPTPSKFLLKILTYVNNSSGNPVRRTGNCSPTVLLCQRKRGPTPESST